MTETQRLRPSSTWIWATVPTEQTGEESRQLGRGDGQREAWLYVLLCDLEFLSSKMSLALLHPLSRKEEM